jgi:hypothetical protein
MTRHGDESTERINFKPTYWGDKLWIVINAIVFSFHEDYTLNVQEHRSLVSFFTSLPELLPCKSCRDHAQLGNGLFDGIQQLKTGKEVQHFVVNVHNTVNERLGKPTLTFEQVKRKYMPAQTKNTLFRNKNHSNNDHNYDTQPPRRKSVWTGPLPAVMAMVVLTFAALALFGKRRKALYPK